MRLAKVLGAAVLAAAAPPVLDAVGGELDVAAEIGPEVRIFAYAPAFTGQRDTRISPSIAAELEGVYETEGGNDRFTIVPFVRLDAIDDERTHADLRAANWLHFGDAWDTVVGLDEVFWGVTESRHLVNIVNQDDAVEDIDGEDKLGQPMLNLNVEAAFGAFSLLVLPGFRERTFPGDDGRLRGPLPIDEDAATFDADAEALHVDFAGRWSRTIGDWDVGLSHFHGTSREPRFVITPLADGPVAVPHYDLIDQTGLDLQLTTERTLWKLEAITRSGHGDRFGALVAGLEHTLFAINDSSADLGLLVEYLYDGRGVARAPPTTADDDLFVGARLVLNDEQDSQALIGGVVDRNTQATLMSLEAERRLGQAWKAELEVRLFLNVDARDDAGGFRDDDFVTFRLTRFF